MTISDDVRAKLDRSAEHLQCLQDEIVNYLNSCPGELACEYDVETATFTLIDKPPTPSLKLAALVGDAVHNLRSSIDLLVFELAYQPGRQTCMPVLKVPPTDARGNVVPVEVRGGVASDVLNEIIRSQPFQYGDRYESHWLWLLNEMWNADKHRLLLTSPAWLNGTWLAHGHIDGVVPGLARMWGATNDAAEYVFEPLNTRVDIDGQIRIQVAFAENTPVSSRGVMETLSWIDLEVRTFIDRLTSV